MVQVENVQILVGPICSPSKTILKYVNRPNREDPILLLYDGHKSHVSLFITDWAKKNNVILFILPPHTSDLLQPINVGIFGPFKTLYN